MPQGKHKKLLTKKAKKGNKGFSIATIAYYGLAEIGLPIIEFTKFPIEMII
jgi:hypothetical protein